jgi:hypothetical protein
MFLRCHSRKKNGKAHRYWSVVESRRLHNGSTAQHQVLYLGEINDSQQSAWRKTLEVFDEDRGRSCQLSLFPDDRAIPADALDAVSVVLSEMRLRRPRSFGDCWLGCLLWKELHLDRFWSRTLGADRGGVPWEKVIELLAVNRLCEPGSEFALHRRWFDASAMDELLGVDFAAAEKDRLYRCLDRVLPHKDALCQHLTERWRTLFDARFDVLLYDLTSTYFEGSCQQIPKARHGYSRDGRGDCRQVVIALVVSADGFPMDRGIPTKATLQRMRDERIGYLVGTPRALLSKLQQDLIQRSWEQVHQGMRVKLLARDGELYVLAQSDDRRHKENAMRRRKLGTLVRGLNRIKRSIRRGRKLDRDQLCGRWRC